MHSSIPPAFLSAPPSGPRPWRPGDALNDRQALLLTQNAPLAMVALAADHPPSADQASLYVFPSAPPVRPRPALRLIRGGRK